MRAPRSWIAPLAALALAAPAAPAIGQGQGVTAEFLQRLASYESELRRLTGRIEELEARLRAQEAETAARIQDIEQRLLTLEGGDPFAGLAPAADESGDAPSAPPAAETPAEETGPGAPPKPLGEIETGPPSVEERAAFEAAMRDLSSLGPEAGRRSVEAFLAEAPESALAGEAWNRVGRAFLSEDRAREAAQSFLIGFRDYGATPMAAENLLGLGRSLAALGRTGDACGAFAELARRFPDASAATRRAAAEAAAETGCN